MYKHTCKTCAKRGTIQCKRKTSRGRHDDCWVPDRTAILQVKRPAAARMDVRAMCAALVREYDFASGPHGAQVQGYAVARTIRSVLKPHIELLREIAEEGRGE